MIARIFLFSETLSLIFAHARKKVCLSFMKNIPFSVPSIFQGFSYFVPFQAIILARSTEKDITGFFEKAACGKAFSDFFVNPHCPICMGWDTFSFLVRTEKDISKFKRYLIILVSCD